MNIPFELFLGFVVACIGLGVFGLIRQPQIPAMLVFAGLFILTISVVTTGVIMGKIPTTSTVSGLTTTYEFEDNIFEFTELPKTLFALLSVIFMLLGAVMVVRN